MISNKGTINRVNGIPRNATIRSEYVRCGNIDCKKCSPEMLNGDIQKQNFHGPYLIAYWKEGKKLRKRYIGKSWDDYINRQSAIKVKLKSSQLRKFKYLRNQASKRNLLAVSYLEKMENGKVSIEWAYRVVVASKRENRILMLMTIAEKEHLRYANEEELWNIISVQMRKQGFDPSNEESIDSYINYKFA